MFRKSIYSSPAHVGQVKVEAFRVTGFHRPFLELNFLSPKHQPQETYQVTLPMGAKRPKILHPYPASGETRDQILWRPTHVRVLDFLETVLYGKGIPVHECNLLLHKLPLHFAWMKPRKNHERPVLLPPDFQEFTKLRPTKRYKPSGTGLSHHLFTQ